MENHTNGSQSETLEQPPSLPTTKADILALQAEIEEFETRMDFKLQHLKAEIVAEMKKIAIATIVCISILISIALFLSGAFYIINPTGKHSL